MDCVGTRLMKSTHFTYYMHSAVKYKNKRETGTAITTTTTTIRFQLRAVTTALSCGGYVYNLTQRISSLFLSYYVYMYTVVYIQYTKGHLEAKGETLDPPI